MALHSSKEKNLGQGKIKKSERERVENVKSFFPRLSLAPRIAAQQQTLVKRAQLTEPEPQAQPSPAVSPKCHPLYRLSTWHTKLPSPGPASRTHHSNLLPGHHCSKSGSGRVDYLLQDTHLKWYLFSYPKGVSYNNHSIFIHT